jgi:hypothetical protein
VIPSGLVILECLCEKSPSVRDDDLHEIQTATQQVYIRLAAVCWNLAADDFSADICMQCHRLPSTLVTPVRRTQVSAESPRSSAESHINQVFWNSTWNAHVRIHRRTNQGRVCFRYREGGEGAIHAPKRASQCTSGALKQSTIRLKVELLLKADTLHEQYMSPHLGILTWPKFCARLDPWTASIHLPTTMSRSNTIRVLCRETRSPLTTPSGNGCGMRDGQDEKAGGRQIVSGLRVDSGA